MNPDTVRARFVYLFATPRWRLLWFVLAVTWCVVFNVLYIQSGGGGSWFGPVSVIPIFWFAGDALARSYRLTHPKSR